MPRRTARRNARKSARRGNGAKDVLPVAPWTRATFCQTCC